VQGNFGYSFHYSQPVWDVIAYKMEWTFVLQIPSVILGATLGIVLGSMAGWRHGSGMDTGVTSLFLFIYSMPHYWLAMIFVLILSGITGGGLAGAEKLKDVL